MSEILPHRVSPSNSEKTWYTYLLIDPRDRSVFYVGKGTGERIHSHVKAVRRQDIGGNPRKYQRIAEIIGRGWKVIEVVFSRHTEESEAFLCEDLLLESLADENLSNIVGSRRVQRAEWCELLLKRLKPFDVWMATCSSRTLRWVEDHEGSARAFYNRYVEEVRKFGCVA